MHRQMFIPVTAPKSVRKHQKLSVFILRHGEHIAVRKRAELGLLAGLWELPNTEAWLDLPDAERWLSSWGLRYHDLRKRGKHRHIFTHIEWDMLCFETECEEEIPAFLWGDEREIALPTAFRRCLAAH